VEGCGKRSAAAESGRSDSRESPRRCFTESRSPFSPPKAESDFSESKPVASAFAVPHSSKIATDGQPQLLSRKGGPASRTWKIAKRVTFSLLLVGHGVKLALTT
jgi:hypothetical protein